MVLSEPFHLSFPNVIYDFQNNQLLMFPETSAVSELRVYTTTPDAFPGGWKLHAAPLHAASGSAARWVDTTMLWSEKEGLWWIWTSENWNLHLFYTEHLLDQPWVEHPASPLYENDRRLGRNGGTFILTTQGRDPRPPLLLPSPIPPTPPLMSSLCFDPELLVQR